MSPRLFQNSYIRRPLLSLLSGIVLSLLLSSPLHADSITLKNGQRHKGLLIGTQAGFVRLVKLEKKGEVEIRFKANEIEIFDFADKELLQSLKHQTIEKRILTLQSLYEKRYPFIEYIQDPDRSLLTQYLEALQETGKHELLLEEAKTLLSHDLPAEFMDSVELLRMEAAWLSKDFPLAKRFAQQRIDADKDSHESALPWFILAADAHEKGDSSLALTFALQPIALSDMRRPRYLAHCYALSVIASSDLQYVKYAMDLDAEMTRKDLPWPRILDRPSSTTEPTRNPSLRATAFPSDVQLLGNP